MRLILLDTSLSGVSPSTPYVARPVKNLRELITSEPAARRLLAAHVQSSLGNGAAYVALLLIAFERFHSPLAVSAVLLCEFVPMLMLGAVMGALADRWSRKSILVAAD